MTDGWDESASAWIAEMGDAGDFARRFVLDRPMLARINNRGFGNALDLGCGEGRFCRLMRAMGIAATGIDPTEALIAQARQRDIGGDYRLGRAEALEFGDGAFDLVVSYLTLVDIPDIRRAIPEMARVLKPGGSLLIANLTSFNTAASAGGWVEDAHGASRFSIDHYLEERPEWVGWRGIKIVNWHRPLRAYMSLLLNQGLMLRYFDEPAPHGGDPERVAHYSRVPFFLIMEWQKPPAGL